MYTGTMPTAIPMATIHTVITYSSDIITATTILLIAATSCTVDIAAILTIAVTLICSHITCDY